MRFKVGKFYRSKERYGYDISFPKKCEGFEGSMHINDLYMFLRRERLTRKIANLKLFTFASLEQGTVLWFLSPEGRTICVPLGFKPQAGCDFEEILK